MVVCRSYAVFSPVLASCFTSVARPGTSRGMHATSMVTGGGAVVRVAARMRWLAICAPAPSPRLVTADQRAKDLVRGASAADDSQVRRA